MSPRQLYNTATYCATQDWDVIIIAFDYVFQSGEDGLPGLNFAQHCSNAPDPANPLLLFCPAIGGTLLCAGVFVRVIDTANGNHHSHLFHRRRALLPRTRYSHIALSGR